MFAFDLIGVPSPEARADMVGRGVQREAEFLKFPLLGASPYPFYYPKRAKSYQKVPQVCPFCLFLPQKTRKNQGKTAQKTLLFCLLLKRKREVQKHVVLVILNKERSMNFVEFPKC